MSVGTKPIVLVSHVEFPGYVLADDGTVFTAIRGSARPMRPSLTGKYAGLRIRSKQGIRGVYVHRLICEAFHGRAPARHEVRHLDGNRLNNAAGNLAWGTRAQNAKDKSAHGTALLGERHHQSKLTEREVRFIRRLSKHPVSIASVLRYFRISRMQHWRIVSGNAWNHIKESP